MDDFSEGIGKNYIRNKKHLPFDLEGVFCCNGSPARINLRVRALMHQHFS